MLGSEKVDSPAEKKHDGYDSVRFVISEKYPKIDPENAVEVLKGVHSLVITGKKDTTTYTEIEKETGISRGTVVSMVDTLESLRYLIVNRKKSGKPFILVSSKPFFGPQIAEEIEKCLQELITVAEKYGSVRNIVGNLPEEANTHFENDDLGNAIKKYNKAVEKLLKAEKEILPLIEWRITAFRISLGQRFYYDYQWK